MRDSGPQAFPVSVASVPFQECKGESVSLFFLCHILVFFPSLYGDGFFRLTSLSPLYFLQALFPLKGDLFSYLPTPFHSFLELQFTLPRCLLF